MADSPAAERRLTEADIRDLLRTQAPHLAEEVLSPIAEEWDNVIWRLGDDHAIRMPRRAAAAPLIEHEHLAMPILGPVLAAVGIRTPMPLVLGRPTPSFPWPWSIVPWIPGTPALTRPRSENSRWAPRLAQALRVLHRPAPAAAPPNPVRGVPLRDRDARTRERLQRHPEFGALAEAWDDGLGAPRSTERVWIHGDLHPGNLVVEGGRLAGIIDFGDVTAGDPAYDLAAGWMLFDPDGRRAFRAAAGERYDQATWIRARAWAAAVSAILIDASDDRPALRRLGLETAAEVSVD